MSPEVVLAPNSDWALDVSKVFRLRYTDTASLIKSGELPSENDVPRDNALKLYADPDCLAALERYRAKFDTSRAAFIQALRDVAGTWLDRDAETPHEAALVEFRAFTRGDIFYPLTPTQRPWRDHRSPVTRDELDHAGYPAFAARWDRPDQDPYRHVVIGGELRLGPSQWAYRRSTYRPDLRTARGVFLARLAVVLEKRQAVQT